MDTAIVSAAAHYAEEVMGGEGYRYVCTVVASCKMLAIELEAEEDSAVSVDVDALVVAGYLHDISTISHGFQDHEVRSAAMAVTFLRERPAEEQVSDEFIQKVERAILAHIQPVSAEEENTSPPGVEGQILYDADKLGRLSGLAVVTSMIEFGARYPNRAVTGDVLATILKHIEERFIELYQSLYTNPARQMAREKFDRTLAFLDGVIEHLSDATPV